jgi:hypothetical protein
MYYAIFCGAENLMGGGGGGVVRYEWKIKTVTCCFNEDSAFQYIY